MQAPPSHTASGEHHWSRLPSSFPSGPSQPPSVADGIGLAHDAGNLLGAIRLYCDLLALPGVLRSEHRHYAEELRLLTARSGSLIDRLLRPAPLGGSHAPANGAGAAGTEDAGQPPESVCPADALMECRGMLEPVAGAGSLLLAVEAGARGRIAVPREALERILLNLIKNAAEAQGTTDRDGEDEDGRRPIIVRVRAVTAWGKEGSDAIAVSVEDRGRGMEEKAVRAALAGTAEHARPGVDDLQHSGRGLGLRVVRELTERTGGALRMQSRVGQGTTVEVVWATAREGAETG